MRNHTNPPVAMPDDPVAMPDEVQEGPDLFFEQDGVRLRYRDTHGFGDEHAPVLLFVHGWALDLRMWRPQAAALGRDHRVIRMDRRGFGGSSGVATPENDARDLLALLDRVAVPPAFVIGMSQGARAALALATVAPERVAGLVLDGAPVVDGLLPASLPATLPDEVPVADLLRGLRNEGIASVRQAIAAHPFMELRTQDSEVRALLARMIGDYRAVDLDARARGSAQEVTLASINVPVLVLNGVHDTAQRRLIGDAYCSALPGAERVLIRGAGHLPNLDNPAEYNAVLTAFIGRHAPTPTESASWRTY